MTIPRIKPEDLHDAHRWFNLDELTHLPGNPNQGDPDSLAASVDEFGYMDGIVVHSGVIVAGNHLVERARAEGEGGLPGYDLTTVLPDIPAARRMAMALAHNHTNRAGRDDPALLAEAFTEIAGLDLQLASVAGIDSLDPVTADLIDVEGYQRSRARPVEPELEGDDLDPEDHPDPITKPGDVWTLGDHLLLCGDSTKRETIERLPEPADLLLTDPPYGVAFGAGTEAKAIRGDLSQAVIPVGFAVALEALTDDGRLYVFGGSDQFAMYLNLWDHHLRQMPRIAVWRKEGFVLRRNGYHSQFELCYWGWKGDGGPGNNWWGDRSTSDIWDVPRSKVVGHPTEKPVALFEIPVRSSCPPGGIVLDPFAGSGVTLAACEALGRRAFLIEYDPVWCDAIALRFQRLTGDRPKLNNRVRNLDR